MATFTFRVVRLTTRLLDERAIAASMPTSIAKCPQHRAFVELRLVGPTLVGTVTISGTVDGAPDTEVVTVSAAIANDTTVVRSCKRFECVTGFTSTSILATVT